MQGLIKLDNDIHVDNYLKETLVFVYMMARLNIIDQKNIHKRQLHLNFQQVHFTIQMTMCGCQWQTVQDPVVQS